MYAAHNDHVDIARLLLDRNANIEAVSINQLTALSLGTKKGHVDIAKLRIDRNANIESSLR